MKISTSTNKLFIATLIGIMLGTGSLVAYNALPSSAEGLGAGLTASAETSLGGNNLAPQGDTFVTPTIYPTRKKRWWTVQVKDLASGQVFLPSTFLAETTLETGKMYSVYVPYPSEGTATDDYDNDYITKITLYAVSPARKEHRILSEITCPEEDVRKNDKCLQRFLDEGRIVLGDFEIGEVILYARVDWRGLFVDNNETYQEYFFTYESTYTTEGSAEEPGVGAVVDQTSDSDPGEPGAYLTATPKTYPSITLNPFGISCFKEYNNFTQSTFGNTKGEVFIACALTKTFDFILWIAFFMGLIMIMVAGYFFMISTGDVTKVLRARRTLSAAIIGMVIAAASLALALYVQSMFAGDPSERGVGLQPDTEEPGVDIDAGLPGADLGLTSLTPLDINEDGLVNWGDMAVAMQLRDSGRQSEGDAREYLSGLMTRMTPNVQRVLCVYLDPNNKELFYACYENWDNARKGAEEVRDLIRASKDDSGVCQPYTSPYDAETLLITTDEYKNLGYIDDQGLGVTSQLAAELGTDVILHACLK